MEMLLVRAAVPFPVARSSQNQAQVPEPKKARHSPCPSQPKYSKANRSSDIHKSGKTPSLSVDISRQNQSLSLDLETISVPPLPLAGSRSVFPSPLKFLWFNKIENETKESDVGGDASCVGDEISSLSLSSNQETPTLTLNRGEESTLREVFSTSNSSDLSNLELNIIQIQDSNDSISKAILGTTEGEDLSKIDAECAKPWLRNFMNIRSFWKKQDTTPMTMASRNDDGKQTGVATIDEEYIAAKNSVLNGGEMDSGEEMMACGEGCSTESLMELKVEAGEEMPHVRIAHTRDSFAKFLHRVPLSELKTVSHMSFISNLAYVIPSIKPGDLLKHHHLNLVTSSLHRKAADAAKEKDAVTEKDSSEDQMSAKDSVFMTILETSKPHDETQEFALEKKRVEVDKRLDFSTSVTVNALADAPQVQSHSTSRKGDEKLSCVEYDMESEFTSAVASFIGATPVTTVVAAEEETKQAVVKDLQSPHSCPCEWYVCDDEASHTRFFAIQGSESWASWQANLLFEPMQFEDPKLGVMAHRGIYEAAKGLYDQMIPLVLAHLKEHGEAARICFTGHSLGGSLAILLSLMLRSRGAAPLSSLLPVYTFGSPYVLCGGDYLLKQLGFPVSHIQMVIMHRDIVPRSFACDYPNHVAEVLKRVNGTFRDHPCLNHQSLLYSPMGEMRILQPAQKQAPAHPFLPAGVGLYSLRHPSFFESEELNGITWSPQEIELRSAQRAFLNTPHPLEILSDRGSYGSAGGISRDHDPRNYAKAVNHLLRQELRKRRRARQEHRRQLWWPLISRNSLDYQSSGDIESSANAGEFRIVGAASSSMGAHYQASKRPASFITDGQGSVSLRNTLVSGSKKDGVSRYSRLIASKHVHMGMLLIFSSRMLILRGLATFIS